MQFGFNLPLSGPSASPAMLARLAAEGEAIGYDYAAISDHIVEPIDIHARYPYSESGEFPAGSRGERHEQLTAIAYLAAKTSRLKFLTSVMVVPHRPAVLTAKILATIDVMSGGRLIVGVGAGWLEEEFVAVGAPPFAERGTATDEYLMAFRELWTKDKPRFDGRFVKFSDILFGPQAGAEAVPGAVDRRRKRVGNAPRRKNRRRLVSDRRQSSASARHHGALPGGGRAPAQAGRRRRPRSGKRRARLSGPSPRTLGAREGRQRRAVPVLRQQRRDHRRPARHARARGKGDRLQFRRAHCRRHATVPRGGRRQIVSEERVHMLACNWRLQRLFAFELRRWEAIEAKRAECASASSNSAPALNLAERMRQTSQAEQPNGRQRPVCRQSRRRPQRPRNPSPSRTCAESDRPKTPSSGQLGSRVGKFELGARLDRDNQGGSTRHAHQEAMAERSIALPPRCGCTGANRRTCLIWPARELSVSAVPARAWVFLQQRRSRRGFSLSNTKAASLRPSRLKNLRPEATAISLRSTAVGRSTERAERTSDVTQIIHAGPMPRPTR